MKRRRYRNIIAAVYNEPWAILPAKLQEICALLDLRADGIELSPDEITARIASSVHSIDPAARGLAQPPSHIAILNVFGVLSQRMNALQQTSGGTSTEQLGQAFDAAIADDSIGAVVLNFDTPGGSVNAMLEMGDRIYNARGTKPIISVANAMMASAGYLIGSAADEIVATPSATDIGSIGVVWVHRDDSKREEKRGTKHEIIRSVDFKFEGSPFEPLSAAARQHIQNKIMAMHELFVTAVARYRGVTAAKVDADFGHGRSLMAADALAAGMIDRIATLDEVLAELGTRLSARNEASGFRPQASAITPPQSTPASTHNSQLSNLNTTEPAMDPKIRAALVSLKLIAENATEPQQQLALDVFFTARGLALPEKPEDVLAVLNTPATQVGSQNAEVGTPAPQPATPAPANPQSAIGVPATVGHPQSPLPQQISYADIHATVQLSRLPDDRQLELLGQLTAEGANLTHTALLDRVNAAAREANPPAGATDIRVNASEVDKFQTAARDAILQRTFKGNNPEQILDMRTQEMVDWKPPARSNYSLMNLNGLAQQCCIAAGLPAQQVLNLAPSQIARIALGQSPNTFGIMAAAGGAFNVSGMFSNILLDASNVSLRRSYNDGRSTYQLWMQRGADAPNFKDVNKIIAGEVGDPRAVPEDGEFEETTLSDGKEKYKLTVWGRRMSLSWQMIVDDTQNAFAELIPKLGTGMRRKQNRLAYQTLKDNNPLQTDSTTLFHADHTNTNTGELTTPADYVSAWNTMSKKMAEQKGLDADSGTLGFTPAKIIYPPALRGIILQTLGSSSVDTNNPGLKNIWQQGMAPVEDSNLSAAETGGSDTKFYLAADKAEVDLIEYAFLQGLEHPVVETEPMFDRLGMAIRIYHAFAVKPLEFRGLQEHTGAA